METEKIKQPQFVIPIKYIGKIKKDEMIEQSINNAHNRWEQCLKEANGDLVKARELYDNGDSK